jgi:hypothetical protein
MSKTKRPFASARQLSKLITQYFEPTEDENDEPPTLAGLAYFLGFTSRQEYESFEAKGKYSALLKRARLRIEAAYEKKLHFHSSSGAVFALRTMARNDLADYKSQDKEADGVLQFEIIQSDLKPASSEKEVVL